MILGNHLTRAVSLTAPNLGTYHQQTKRSARHGGAIPGHRSLYALLAFQYTAANQAVYVGVMSRS